MGGALKSKINQIESELNVFDYIDYREFLTDWFAVLKKRTDSFTAHAIAGRSGISKSYLSMVLKGTRSLSSSYFDKLSPHLDLTEHEVGYLKCIVDLSDAETQDQRVLAFDKMKEYSIFKANYSKDINSYKYLKAWYYPAIRELVLLDDFKMDPRWIKSKLRYPVSIPEIREAMYFLLENGFLTKDENGKIHQPDLRIDCVGGIFRLAMSQYHSQVLELAKQSIYNTPRDERNLITQTTAIKKDDFDKLKDIIQDTNDKIEKLAENTTDLDTVYQISLYAFPVSNS